MEIKKEKSEKYSIIKTISMILVVIAHVTRFYTGKGVVQPLNTSSSLNYITNFIYGFHMPLFIFISGAVYYFCIYDLGKYKDKKRFIISKFKRLIIPYLIFGLFYVTPVMIKFHFTNDSIFKYIIKGILLCGDSRHLWFLYYLFIYFIIYYFIFKNTNKLKILCLLNVLYIVLNSMKISIISNLALYALFFNLGMIFDLYYERIKMIFKKNKYIYLAFILLIIAYIFLIQYCSIGILNNIVGLLISLFLIMIVPLKMNKMLNFLSNYSMGIYLFHPMIIYIMFYYFGRYNISPYVLSIFVFVVTILISILLTFIVKKAKINFILGEK